MTDSECVDRPGTSAYVSEGVRGLFVVEDESEIWMHAENPVRVER